MPARKVPSISANNARSNRQPQRLRDLDSITAQREHLMTELARLRANCGSDKVIDSVQQLLTRWWSPASWHARKELLKTAEWFLRLERTGSD